MRALVTGGAGFLGRRLAASLLERASLERLVLLDVAFPSEPVDPRVGHVAGDVADRDLVRRALRSDTTAVFHLAAVVSAEAESDFDLGVRVNVDGTRTLLEACRALAAPPVFVFASSIAVYGGVLPAVVSDGTALAPQSSYGAQKAIGELFVNDYSRKGFVDGRAVRLPIVAVRPGKPNRAASSFASSIVREPLSGEECVCPVAPTTGVFLLSPRKAIANLSHAHDLPKGACENRSVMLPGLSITAGSMAEELGRVAGSEVAARIRWAHDDAIDRIVSTWPSTCDTGRARSLGFSSDADFTAIIRAFIEDDLSASNSAARSP